MPGVQNRTGSRRAIARLGMRSLSGIRRFGRDEAGLTSVFFGIMFTVMFLVFAITVDVTRALNEKSREQLALDAATLAASNYLGLENEDEVGQIVAQQYFAANLKPGSTATITVDLDGVAGRVTAQSNNIFATPLLAAVSRDDVRRDNVQLGAASSVVKGSGTIEVAMVLDNSGSMSGTKIETLKQASHDLVGIVYAGAEGTGDVKIGVVPFAASVNIGANNAGQDWMDNDGLSSLNDRNFSEHVSRFDMFDRINTDWAGCVEARPAPNDVSDLPPNTSLPDTLFVPMFAPDEPNDVNASAAGYSTDGGQQSGYNNNYLNDFGGSCPAQPQQCKTFNKKKGICTLWGPVPMAVADAQKRVCKYTNATPSTFEGSAPGPNHLCDSRAITPMTAYRQDVDSAVDLMIAKGNTNISEGTAWGLRVLSPTLPFAEGKPYGNPDNRKVLVVMTDGDNYLDDKSQHNKSVYASFGYGADNRLGTTYTSNSYMNQINSKTLSACSAAKAQNITVYTVAFGTEISSTGLSLLQSCATSQDHAFIATDNNELLQAFQNIGREISKLRINS